MLYKKLAWSAALIILVSQSGTTTWSHDLLIMAVGAYLGWTFVDVWR